MRRVRESLRYTNGRRVIRASKGGGGLEGNNNSERKDKPPYVDLTSNVEAHDLDSNKREYISEKSPSKVQYEGRVNAGFMGDEFVEGGGLHHGWDEGEYVDHQMLAEQMIGNYVQLDMPALPPGDKDKDLPPVFGASGGKESKESDSKKGIAKYLKNPSSILFNS